MNQEQNRQLMHTLGNGGRTNLLEWVEQIVNDFCEEQAIDEKASFESRKDHFDDDFHEIFLCTVLTLLFIFPINKGIAHIIEPRPPLIEPISDNDKK